LLRPVKILKKFFGSMILSFIYKKYVLIATCTHTVGIRIHFYSGYHTITLKFGQGFFARPSHNVPDLMAKMHQIQFWLRFFVRSNHSIAQTPRLHDYMVGQK